MDDTPQKTPGRPRARIKTMDAAAAFAKSKSAEVLAAKVGEVGAVEKTLPTDDQVGDIPATGKAPRRSKPRKEAHGLMPLHHPNRDFFLCDMFDYALKDDGVSMEAPIFSLSTKGL